MFSKLSLKSPAAEAPYFLTFDDSEGIVGRRDNDKSDFIGEKSARSKLGVKYQRQCFLGKVHGHFVGIKNEASMKCRCIMLNIQ